MQEAMSLSMDSCTPLLTLATVSRESSIDVEIQTVIQGRQAVHVSTTESTYIQDIKMSKISNTHHVG